MVPYHVAVRNQQISDAQNSFHERRRNVTFKSFRKNYDEKQVEYYEIGLMNNCCSHCGARMWRNEKLSSSTRNLLKFGMCCRQGKIKLCAPSPIPNVLRELYEGVHVLSGKFFEQIRGLNSALSFTSLGINLDKDLATSRHGIFTFRIHGAIYHNIGSLIPAPNNMPKFSQIYFYDIDHELDNRHNQMSFLDRNLLGELQDLQNKFNPFAIQFKVIVIFTFI